MDTLCPQHYRIVRAQDSRVTELLVRSLERAADDVLACQRMSEDRGARMDSPASKSEIQRFLKLYKDQISTEDIADDLDSFKTFNEFFYRRLKPGARPIGHPDDDQVLTSAADCRLMAFDSVEESTRFWIKVRALPATPMSWSNRRLFIEGRV